MSKLSESSGSEGVEAVDPPASKHIKSITDVAMQVTAAVGGGGRGRGQQRVWKCNGIFKTLTKVCGFELKGGQKSCWPTAWHGTSYLVVAMAGGFHMCCAA
eukprot:363998-Chlamydomonas_euryale.AAC.7